jgi:hypothetical protein
LPLVSLVHGTLRGRHTHRSITKCASAVICLLPGHVQRMDRIRLTPDFERHVQFSITINDPNFSIELLTADQLGTLGTRVDRIHDITVAQRMLGVRNTRGKREGIKTHLGNWGMEKPVSKTTCNCCEL